jgi:glycosyltransferase involved in cell wall biosynthesis
VVKIPRPLGSNLLGERLLERAGLAEFRRHPSREKLHFVGNSGSCPGSRFTWAHYVHHAWRPSLEASGASVLRRVVSGARSLDARARELRAFKAASLVVTNSDRTSRDVEACGVSRDKVRRVYLGAVPLGARTASSGYGSRAPTVLFVGALGWDIRKGLDLALRAFGLAARRGGWNHRLVIAGNGATQPWVNLARELGILERVDFVGFVEQPETLLASADLFLSPVRYEPYGLAIQEALCAGTPTLFSRAAGIAERLPPECANLVVRENADAAEWASSLAGALEDLEGVRASVRAAREELLRWSWKDFARTFIGLVEEWHSEHRA